MCLTNPACSASTCCHVVAEVVDEGFPAMATTTASSGPVRSTAVASAAAAPSKPPNSASAGTVAQATPRALRVAVIAAARSGRSLTRPHERTTGDGSSSATWSSKIVPNRGLLPPPLAWCASAGASAPAVTASSTWANDVGASMRTTSSSRGGSITAASEPPTKMTCPWHHENSSPTRCAPKGPSWSGAGIAASERPPEAADREARPTGRGRARGRR